MAKANAKRRPISLALQGGGVHGAYTWAVLDRLSEDESLNIAAISATSASAMNTDAYAAGLARGCPEGARAELEALWRRVSESSAALGAFGQAGIAFAAALQSLASPYDLNPFNFNPLRRLVQEQVDFDAVRASGLTLFISATNVETASHVSSRRMRSPLTRCSPRPACRRVSRRSRSTARPIGTAAIWAIPASSR